MRRTLSVAAAALILAGCNTQTTNPSPVTALSAPTNLTYEVEPSGTSGQPSGVLLRWNSDTSSSLSHWNVYSRGTSTGAYVLRASTTSNSFHDTGQPQLDYIVTAVDGIGSETGPSNTVEIDEHLVLSTPVSLTSVSLNGSVGLFWSDNAYTANPTSFKNYRVYSTSYDLDHNVCGTTWQLEGTTVAPEFRVGALVNGVPKCFGVSAISLQGYESLWSPLRNDTPRPDARNVLLTTEQSDNSTAGFRYWDDQNADHLAQVAELGHVGSANSNADFVLERDVTGKLFLTPTRTGTSVAVYGSAPVEDLTSIDIAPSTGFATTAVEAVPGWGYVFKMDGGDAFSRFGALRVSHAGRDIIIFDWAFQTDPGNPELSPSGR